MLFWLGWFRYCTTSFLTCFSGSLSEGLDITYFSGDSNWSLYILFSYLSDGLDSYLVVYFYLSLLSLLMGLCMIFLSFGAGASFFGSAWRPVSSSWASFFRYRFIYFTKASDLLSFGFFYAVELSLSVSLWLFLSDY